MRIVSTCKSQCHCYPVLYTACCRLAQSWSQHKPSRPQDTPAEPLDSSSNYDPSTKRSRASPTSPVAAARPGRAPSALLRNGSSPSSLNSPSADQNSTFVAASQFARDATAVPAFRISQDRSDIFLTASPPERAASAVPAFGVAEERFDYPVTAPPTRSSSAVPTLDFSQAATHDSSSRADHGGFGADPGSPGAVLQQRSPGSPVQSDRSGGAALKPSVAHRADTANQARHVSGLGHGSEATVSLPGHQLSGLDASDTPRADYHLRQKVCIRRTCFDIMTSFTTHICSALVHLHTAC